MASMNPWQALSASAPLLSMIPGVGLPLGAAAGAVGGIGSAYSSQQDEEKRKRQMLIDQDKMRYESIQANRFNAMAPGRGQYLHGGNTEMEPYHNLTPDQYDEMRNQIESGELVPEVNQEGYKTGGWIKKAVNKMEKKETKGSFRKWAQKKGYKSGADPRAISAGLNSENPAIRKKAAFAKAMTKFQDGGKTSLLKLIESDENKRDIKNINKAEKINYQMGQKYKSGLLDEITMEENGMKDYNTWKNAKDSLRVIENRMKKRGTFHHYFEND